MVTSIQTMAVFVFDHDLHPSSLLLLFCVLVAPIVELPFHSMARQSHLAQILMQTSLEHGTAQEAMITSSGFHTLCSSSPKEAGSLVKDHGADDEYTSAGKHLNLKRNGNVYTIIFSILLYNYLNPFCPCSIPFSWPS